MANEETLRSWVAENKVCWDLSPLVELERPPNQPPARIRVGLEVLLYGTDVKATRPLRAVQSA